MTESIDVLIADDNPDHVLMMRRWVADALDATGRRAQFFTTCDLAQAVTLARSGIFDLIVCDFDWSHAGRSGGLEVLNATPRRSRLMLASSTRPLSIAAQFAYVEKSEAAIRARVIQEVDRRPPRHRWPRVGAAASA